ncbi:MAG TPA: response regulator, partial [Burkholderiaceae bacterium]|nr:response regulator [Burkholderiaceae bacterium]
SKLNVSTIGRSHVLSVQAAANDPNVAAAIANSFANVYLAHQRQEKIDAAASGETALPLLEQARPDVLFSDVSLPGMSGVELARQALARQPGLQLLFVSGYGDALTRHLPWPATTLQKPYELEQLQLALATIGRRLQDDAR